MNFNTRSKEIKLTQLSAFTSSLNTQAESIDRQAIC